MLHCVIPACQAPSFTASLAPVSMERTRSAETLRLTTSHKLLNFYRKNNPHVQRQIAGSK